MENYNKFDGVIRKAPIGLMVIYAGKLHVRDQYDRIWCLDINLKKAETDNPFIIEQME